MGDRGAHTIARLTKADVEELLARYDDDPEDALTTALRRVLDRSEGTLADLVAAGGLDPAVLHDVDARDRLVRDLNELRGLPR